jgi:hypothetical protein
MRKRSKEATSFSGSVGPPSNQSVADQPKSSDVKHFLSLGSKVSPRPCWGHRLPLFSQLLVRHRVQFPPHNRRIGQLQAHICALLVGQPGSHQSSPLNKRKEIRPPRSPSALHRVVCVQSLPSAAFHLSARTLAGL